MGLHNILNIWFSIEGKKAFKNKRGYPLRKYFSKLKEDKGKLQFLGVECLGKFDIFDSIFG